jgi:hypothetical protein
MPTFLFFTEQAGDKFKLEYEVERDDDRVDLALDELLDADPKAANKQPFKVVTDDNWLTVEADEEVVQPKRNVRVNGAGAASKPAARPRRRAAAVEPDEEEAVTEAPKRRGRPPGSKNKNTRSTRKLSAAAEEAPKRRGRPPGSKNATKATPAKRSAAKPSGNPMKRSSAIKPNAASAE